MRRTMCFILFVIALFNVSNAAIGKAKTLRDVILREEEDFNSAEIGTLRKGDVVDIIKETENSFKVQKNNLVGWAEKFNFNVISLNENGNELNNSYQFSKIPWGSSPEKVKQILESKYIFETEAEGDLIFQGNILGSSVTIFAFFTQEKKLAKIVVSLKTEENTVIDKYNEMKEILTKKYGKPEKIFEYFESPYEKGDGYEEQAISVNKGHFASFWPIANDNSNLLLEISSTLSIDVSYESKEWSAEVNRRKEKEISDF